MLSPTLPRRHRIVKSRGTIALFILAPFLVLALLSSPVMAQGWWELPLEGLGWIAFAGGIAMRWWASAYIAGRKGQALFTDGPYSICRNPLYLGTLMMLVGFACFVQSLTFATGALLASLVYLGLTIGDEEYRLLHKFGPAYLAYCHSTPRLLPRPALLKTPQVVEVNIAGLAREFRSATLYLWLPFVGRLLLELRDSRVLPALLHLP